MARIFELPETLPSEVREAIENWVEYRREIKKPYTERSLVMLLKSYSGRDEDLVRDIEYSIQQGWQGVYSPKDVGPGISRKPTAEDMLKQKLATLRRANG